MRNNRLINSIEINPVYSQALNHTKKTYAVYGDHSIFAFISRILS